MIEFSGVYPDREVGELLRNIFGKYSMPASKYARMQYWMPKFKHINPWPYPRQGVPDKIESSKLALKIMGSPDVENEITVFEVIVNKQKCK